NDTIGIVSHDPTLAHLWRRLAALAFTTPTRPHLASVIRHLSSAIRHLPSVIRLFSFPIPRSEFRIPHFLAERFLCRLSRSPMAHLPGSLIPKEIRSGSGRRHVETTRSTQHL